jgi:hypothetical protein
VERHCTLVCGGFAGPRLPGTAVGRLSKTGCFIFKTSHLVRNPASTPTNIRTVQDREHLSGRYLHSSQNCLPILHIHLRQSWNSQIKSPGLSGGERPGDLAASDRTDISPRHIFGSDPGRLMCGWPPTCKSFFREEHWSLAVMCPAFRCDLT